MKLVSSNKRPIKQKPITNTHTNPNNTNNPNNNTNTNTNKSIPPSAKDVRLRYILGFVLLIIVCIVLYIFNPYDLLTTYVGPTMFIILFLGIFLITMIVFYDYVWKHSPSPNIPSHLPSNIFFVLFAFLVSIGFIMLILWSLGLLSNSPSSSASSISGFIINFLLLFVILAIVYKIFTLTSGSHEKDKTKEKGASIFQLFLQSLFYLPHLFVQGIEMLSKEYNQTSGTILILLFIEIILLVLYFVLPTITSSQVKQGGQLLTETPVSLDTSYTVSTYQKLNESDEYNYHYALSFWFFLDSMPPSTNASYSSFANILSYGNNPVIQYNASENTLLITVDSNKENQTSIVEETHTLEKQIPTIDLAELNDLQYKIRNTITKVKEAPILYPLDDSGKRIIYENRNVLLQKWNHILLNYNGGTLDVFYNGELVKSAIEVVPYVSYDTLMVGQDKGLSGGISNLLYFKKPLNGNQIQQLYHSGKSHPPS